MMINTIASLPGVAPAAAAGNSIDTGFASVLDSELAAVTDRLLPLIQGKEQRPASDKLNEEDVDAVAAWLLPAVLPDAMVASLPSAAVAETTAAGQPAMASLSKAAAPQIAQPGNALHVLTNDTDALQGIAEKGTLQTARQNSADEMLRMIASPQAAHHSGKPAEPNTQQSPAPDAFIKQATGVAQGLEGEGDHAVLPVDNRMQTVPLTAAPATSPASLAIPAAASSTSSTLLPVAYGVLEPEVGSPAWQQALSQKLNAFTRNGVHHAELRLHPEHLGPLQIKLRLDQDQVQLHFVTDHQPVRAALETAMPHLRTSLAEAGIQLDQGSVGHDGAAAWGSSADSDSGQSSLSQKEAGAEQLIEVEEEITPQRIYSPMGISIFA
ncbi:flagellar hook-length control protein FliK [Pantoea alhagi]|uniref:flagellar hook-length control protein FliK n=1 Tax=Pantoea alhagi TaxID=1891675 RepID=UPI00202B3D3F|nr:flagellar hook-length control protein FliK [Pantoea alhagi]URQ60878.1 flagellar hook-length control protein FliK [Pantoea alhagi]